MRGSERRVWEGKRLLRVDEEPFPVEPRTLAFMCLVGTQDLRGVMGVDVLGEGLEEFAELPSGLVGERWEFQDQTVARGHVVGGFCGIGNHMDGAAPRRSLELTQFRSKFLTH